MKTNQSSESRSERARNEERDSNGRFESSDHKENMKGQKSSGTMNHHRGENAQNEKRDSNGRFESENGRKK
ncbi:hypothetical protein [Bacteroides sp. 51]|uniref:hypothetical protein n=1 Tax=Bacteroides sp. 51 TaxID=2302938 RepID=UPI0013D5B079|nr:hypothetical protein [Bacteroides sp. 51]NDV80614.1 hypothetical protein [Bacteroides sp. 51]